MEREEILTAAIVEILNQFREIGKQITKEYENSFNNSWVVPYLVREIEKFKPQTLNNKNINYSSGEITNIETFAREKIEKAKEKTTVKVGLALTGGLPEEKIYKAASKADKLKKSLYQRGEKETEALIQKANQYRNAEELIKTEFSTSKAFRTIEDHKNHTEEFSALFTDIMDDFVEIGIWFNKKTSIPIVGKKIRAKVNPIVQELLKVDATPDWENLPQDIKFVSKILVKSYKNFEEELAKKRYN